MNHGKTTGQKDSEGLLCEGEQWLAKSLKSPHGLQLLCKSETLVESAPLSNFPTPYAALDAVTDASLNRGRSSVRTHLPREC